MDADTPKAAAQRLTADAGALEAEGAGSSGLVSDADHQRRDLPAGDAAALAEAELLTVRTARATTLGRAPYAAGRLIAQVRTLAPMPAAEIFRGIEAGDLVVE